MKRTRLSVCRRKARFVSECDALVVANAGRVPLRMYRCDRCLHFHLTSRTKGQRIQQARSPNTPESTLR